MYENILADVPRSSSMKTDWTHILHSVEQVLGWLILLPNLGILLQVSSMEYEEHNHNQYNQDTLPTEIACCRDTSRGILN